MNIPKTFEAFFAAIKLPEANDFDSSLENIAKKLNERYYDSDPSEDHIFVVGSIGRGTAVSGVSDVDVIFELPRDVKTRIDGHEGNGQSHLLQEVRGVLSERYPNTTIKGDGQVVAIQFEKYTVEVVPGFRNEDGSFQYPDSNHGGRWRRTDPIPEQEKSKLFDEESNGCFVRLCNAIRVWKDNIGFHFGGLLVDTLVCDFLEKREGGCDFDIGDCPDVLEELFSHLAKEDEGRSYWHALGSNQQIDNKDGGEFVRHAREAAEKISESDPSEYEKVFCELFGKRFGKSVVEGSIRERRRLWRERYDYWDDHEEFIEDRFPIDIKGSVSIDCKVIQDGFTPKSLRRMIRDRMPLLRGRRLVFEVEATDTKKPYSVYWKVRNCGEEAYRRKMVRGEIWADEGKRKREEHADFKGDHYVECYIVKDGACVARAHIGVPISAD